MNLRTRVIVALALAVPVGLAAWSVWQGDLLGGFLGGSRPIPRPAMHVALVDPLSRPGLEGYREYRDALEARDHAALDRIAYADDSFLAYRAALSLARAWDLSPADRIPYYVRADDLRLADSLARIQTREFHLEVARTAESAGDTDTAIAFYTEALATSEAQNALARLEDDAYRLANTYFQARLYGRALDALDGRAAPSITAPSYRALGDHAAALESYEDWLAQEPDNLEALSGRAWSHFYLADNELADAYFSELTGSNAAYGRGLLANRAGDITGAVAFLGESGEPAHLWLATDLLENRGMLAEALPVYERLAAGNSVYADQAAYRALVLSERLGDDARAQAARAQIRPGSYFSLVLGEPLVLDLEEPAGTAEPPVLDLADMLARLGDVDAAIGELLFALRNESGQAATLAIASKLQAFGEYRQSRLAAQAIVDAGSLDARAWRLAWPEAWPDLVRAHAGATGVEPELVWAIMRQESAFYPLAVSTSNAQGLMQVIPSTWDWLAELQREDPADSFDVSANIRYGAFYLNWLLNYLDGDLELAVASYNRGQGYISRLFAGDEVAGDKSELYRQIDAQETRNYLERVMVNYHIYHALSRGVNEQASLVSAPR